MKPDDPQLTAYVLGELSAEEKAAVDAALKNSPELQQAVADIRETTGLLTGAFQSEPQPELKPEQRAAIEEQSTAVASKPAPLQPGAGWTRSVMASAAAVLLLVTGFGVYATYYSGTANTTFNSISNAISNANDDGVEVASTPPPGGPGLIDDTRSMDGEFDDRLDALNSTVEGAWNEQYEEGSPRPGFSSLPSGGITGEGVSGRGAVNSDGRPGSRDSYGNEGTTVQSPRFTAGPAPTGNTPPRGPAEPTSPEEGFGATPGGQPLVRDPASTTPGVPADPADFGGEPEPTVGDTEGEAPSSSTAPATRPASDEETVTEAVVDDLELDSAEKAEVERLSGEAQKSAPGSNDVSSLKSGLAKDGKKSKPKDNLRTWRRAKATPNASRLMIGDKDELPLEGMQVNVQVDGFRARVLLDLYYYNNRGRQLEGAFKVRLPNEASLYYFAFGETSFEYRPQVDQLASNGFLNAELVRASGTGPGEILKARSETWSKVKEARIVPREQAAHAYSETVRRRIDPALVEWSGAGMFNAKVYPLMPGKLHRIVIGYDVNLRQDGDDLVYALDLPEHRAETSVDLNVSAMPGTSANIKPEVRPFLASGRAYYHYANPKQNQIEVRLQNPGAVLLQGGDQETGEYFATRITPNLPASKPAAGSKHAIFLLDTSLSSNPDKFNVWLSLLEETLTKNRDVMKHFAVLTFNIESHWWRPQYMDNTPENVKRLIHDCSQLSLEGATALRQALAEAISPVWGQAKKLPKPDIFLLSDGAATWGETSLPFIARTLGGGKSATLFAYNTGLTGTAVNVLQKLTRDSGGAVFSVMGEADVAKAATAHRQRPWRLHHATVAGGEDILLAGRTTTLYPGQTLLLCGRGKPTGDVMLRVSRGEETETISIPLTRTVKSELTPRLYGEVAVGQLEDLQAATYDVSVAYARHFRVTGQTCSLLMLDSEADYKRFNIKPEDDVDVIKTVAAANYITRRADETAAKLEDPKATLLAWMEKLEKTPGVQFKTPTALRLMLEQLPASAFEVEIPRLVCEEASRSDMSKEMLQVLAASQLDYDAIVAEANRRRGLYGPADALKTLSSLIENTPGDTVLSRDVAFSAMDMGLAGQAYPLLKRVAEARPYLPQVYQAMAQCLASLGNADLAMIYYEIALGGQWHGRYQDFKQIAAVEYSHLLRKIKSGELKTQAPGFAKTRMQTVASQTPFNNAGLVVTMMWNTDRTDVDLHVVEPSGEEVFYKHRNSRAGGKITRDVTEGFGPEMYSIGSASKGRYTVKANYYGTDANRTTARSKVYLTIYENFGKKNESVTRKTVSLSRGKEMRTVATVQIKQ